MIALVDVPGTDALEPCDFLRRFSIRGPLEMSLIRPGGTQDPFKLHARNDIGISAVGIGLIWARVVRLESRGEDNGARSNGPSFLFFIEANGLRRTEFLAGPAFSLLEEDAVILVNDIFKRDRLGVFHIDGLALNQIPVEEVIHLFWAFLGAGSACNTPVHVDITGMSQDLYLEISGLAMDGGNIGQCHQFDI